MCRVQLISELLSDFARMNVEQNKAMKFVKCGKSCNI
jgi:hypothetical protein